MTSRLLRVSEPLAVMSVSIKCSVTFAAKVAASYGNNRQRRRWLNQPILMTSHRATSSVQGSHFGIMTSGVKVAAYVIDKYDFEGFAPFQ